MGSYLLIIAEPPSSSERPSPPSRAPVRVPVFIGRNAEENVAVTLYREAEIPEGFVQIPAGRFLFQGDRINPYSGPQDTLDVGDFFLAELPVSCADYLSYLNELALEDPEAASRHVPRESEKAGFYWPRDAAGRYAVPTKAWLAKAPPEAKAESRRLAQAQEDWDERWPVLGVSWEDALAYAVRLARRTGRLLSLPHEVLWEKGVRGVDGRDYPWGDHHDDARANGLRSREGPPAPSPAGAFSADESPCGVRDLAGNAVDWCLNEVDDGKRRLLRGGSWVSTGLSVRAAARMAGAPARLAHGNGFRLCCMVSTKSPAPPWQG